MPSNTEDFFSEPLEQSRVKARIVSDYVVTFTRILSDHKRSIGEDPTTAFVDLFSGPGSYADGTASTPLLVIRAAVRDPKLRSALQTFFNDIDPTKIDQLRDEISKTQGIESLRHQPRTTSQEATLSLVKSLSIERNTPTLFFLDPFGYKILSLPLLRSLLSTWAECLSFFNYRRVIAALNNTVFAQHMQNLFGESRLESLRKSLDSTNDVHTREHEVLKHLEAALLEAGGQFVLKFAFKVDDSHRSTHYLIFVTGHRKGYDAMKRIMASESSSNGELGPSMTFTQRAQTANLFDRDPVTVLGEELQQHFAGRVLTVDDIYGEYGTQTSFTETYFRRALLTLESSGHVSAEPPAAKRRNVSGVPSLAGSVQIRFPGV